MFNKYTQWIPLYNYNSIGDDGFLYIIIIVLAMVVAIEID